MKETLYSVVVPVYKSERSLTELYTRLRNTFREIEGEFELIMVEDCGGDGSWDVMQSLRNQDRRVKIVRLVRNFGQHNALMCGFSFAAGDYVVTMDDDLQTPPEEIPKLIEAIQSTNLDVVYGIPNEKKHGAVRIAGSRIYSRLLSLIFSQVPELKISAFRIVRKEIVDRLGRMSAHNPIVGSLLLHVTERTGNVVVEHRQRRYGQSTYNTVKLAKHFLGGVLFDRMPPMKAVSHLGVFSLCLSAVPAFYCLIHSAFGLAAARTLPEALLLLFFFSGLIMFSLGTIGGYLLRVFHEFHPPLQYIVRDREVD